MSPKKLSSQGTLHSSSVSPSEHQKPSWPMLLAVVSISLGGLALFSTRLGRRDFWFDEGCSFIYVHRLFDWPNLSKLLIESTNLPYYFCAYGWTELFGHSEVAYRSLSVLFATLTVPLLSWAAYRLAGPIAAISCAVLAVTNPLLVYYAQEARAYAMWVFVLTGCFCLLLKAIERGQRRYWIAYGLAVWFCLHLHYYTLFWVPTTMFAILIAQDRRCAWRQWFVTTCLACLAFLPYFVVAVLPASQGGGSAWINRSFHAGTALVETVWSFLPAGSYPGHLRGLSLQSPDSLSPTSDIAGLITTASKLVPAIVWLVLFVICVSQRFARTSRAESSHKNRNIHIMLAGMTFGPLLLAWVYSVAIRPIYLPGRYDLVAWPTFTLWSAFLIATVSKRLSSQRSGLIALCICLILVSCSAVPLTRFLSLSPPPSLAHLRANRIAKLTKPNDLMITFSYDNDYLKYYLYREDCLATLISFPSWLDKQVGWIDTNRDLSPDRATKLTQDATLQVKRVTRSIDDGQRVWLIGDSMDRSESYSRRPINNILISQLLENDFALRTESETLGIYEIQRR